ncbi:hypothetical protein ACW7EA_28795, partial [Pseudomonas aeruginosa]
MKKATRIGLWASGSLVALAAIALGYAWQPAIGPLEGTPGPFSAEQMTMHELEGEPFFADPREVL